MFPLCEGLNVATNTYTSISVLSYSKIDAYGTRLDQSLISPSHSTEPPNTKPFPRSVVFGGTDLKAATEDVPYPSTFLDPFSAAVAEAEQEVLRANGTGGGMLTCSLRPATVYGPRDHHLLPELISRTRRGVKAIGDGSNVTDYVYVGNVAHSHLLAGHTLLPLAQGKKVTGDKNSGVQTASGGRAYFVTDGEPSPNSEFVNRALAGLGYRAPGPGWPLMVATFFSVVLHLLSLLLAPLIGFKPTLTHRRVAEEGKFHYFSIARAKMELGYEPIWTQQEGMEITLQASSALRNPLAKLKHSGPFTASEVAKHSTEDDAWIIVDGKVYDVTPYLNAHPGGDAMLRNAGGDSSKGMHGPQHPTQALEILAQHYIGELKT
ncbi:unnamed protein product [Choristocarpus tenellus]